MRTSIRTGRGGEPPLALEIGDRFVGHLHVQLEPERRDMARLLRAEQIAGAANLEVAHRDREACAELGVVGERRESSACLVRQLVRVGIEQVRVCEPVAAADAAAYLVELAEPELVGAL